MSFALVSPENVITKREATETFIEFERLTI